MQTQQHNKNTDNSRVKKHNGCKEQKRCQQKQGCKQQYRDVNNSTSLNRDESNSRDASNGIELVGWMDAIGVTPARAGTLEKVAKPATAVSHKIKKMCFELFCFLALLSFRRKYTIFFTIF
jgi:hypothetical protein